MSQINIYEKAVGGRSGEAGDKSSRQIELIVNGSEDQYEIESALLAGTPVYNSDMTLKRTGVKSQEIEGLPGWWTATANYESVDAAQKDPGGNSVSFSTTGGKQKITQSKKTRGRYAATGVAPDMKGAIGATKPGEDPEGVEITVPVFEFQEQWVFTEDQITPAYVGTLIRMTGKTNTTPFRTLVIGECLFMGAEGQRRPDGCWEITYKFAGSPDAEALKVGDITVTYKAGWDYLWVRYEQKEVGTGADKVLASIPKYAYVEQVYDEADFAVLGIGN